MHVLDVLSNKSLLAITAGVGYALATLLMKMASDDATIFVIGAIAIVLTGVATAEILLLRQVSLGLAYVAIIATESILVLAATYLVGEPLSARELVGGGFVIFGAALVSF
ncbi:hypothetical protein [Marivita hallyeonensis]|uniref:5-aminolevulinate synthase n=1 Tax=Marivita hallyeonensis TaxID=996342 RepID=A0A1M5XYZ9_9RHOB|nr:hypothetical protein [Marivita hallyeonensis]SHI05035.1 hypothetical protein SAMN05443551_4230 [Marivita hallyeonensis]